MAFSGFLLDRPNHSCHSNADDSGGDNAIPVGGFPLIESGSAKLMIRIEVTLNADATAISPVVEGIMEMARRMDCAAGKEFEVETALREALANAILHGCKNDPAKRVQCCVSCDEEHGLLIVVRDPGTGFNPVAIPDPLHGENVYSKHGRGIFLINQLMDEVRFERNGTEIHMRKY
jgi:serine/threonine-protein kinase RsbW